MCKTGAEREKMVEWSLRFYSNRLKQLQEEMITAYSNLTDALKEIETEQEYLSGIWQGEAADAFLKLQRNCFRSIGECAEKTEELLLSLEYAEGVFRQCEKKVEKITGEVCIWEI